MVYKRSIRMKVCFETGGMLPQKKDNNKMLQFAYLNPALKYFSVLKIRYRPAACMHVLMNKFQ